MTKKLRKKVVVKNEEKVEPEEVSNQENKNSEFEQQVNENESKTDWMMIKMTIRVQIQLNKTESLS